jgi:hypothetical protein
MFARSRQAGRATAFALSILLWSASVSVASAHDSWLHAIEPVQPDGPVIVGLNSGMGFPALEQAVQADRLASASLACPGAPRAAIGPAEESGALRLAVRCAAPGLAVVDVALAPRTLTLSDDQVDHYLEEIAAGAEIRERWAAQSGRTPWEETYAKSARLALVIGDAPDARAWTEALGRRDELLPVTPWPAVRAAGGFALRLLADGRPVQGVAIGMRAAGVAQSTFAVTDADGTARFTLGSAGPVLFHSTQLAPAPDGKWHSRFVTLAFEIAPR